MSRSQPPNENISTRYLWITPEECERTARLLTGDRTIEPKGEYDYEWYVGGQRFRAAVHAGGYMNQPVMIRWQIDSLWGEAGVLQHPEDKYVDRDDSAITFGQEYRDPRYRREIELSDGLAAQLQADIDRLRQIETDSAVVETNPDAFPARIPQVCYLDSDEVRFYNRLAWDPGRRAMFYEAGGGPDFIFPVQKLDDYGSSVAPIQLRASSNTIGTSRPKTTTSNRCLCSLFTRLYSSRSRGRLPNTLPCVSTAACSAGAPRDRHGGTRRVIETTAHPREQMCSGEYQLPYTHAPIGPCIR